MTTITWIPVTERLPDADITVLVWTKAGEWWSAWHDEHWHDASNGLVLCGDYEPTHWGEPQGPGEAKPPAPVLTDADLRNIARSLPPADCARLSAEVEALRKRSTGWVAPRDRYAVPVLFNPYTGEPRDVRDVQSDPQGILIAPPGRVDMLAARPGGSNERS